MPMILDKRVRNGRARESADADPERNRCVAGRACAASQRAQVPVYADAQGESAADRVLATHHPGSRVASQRRNTGGARRSDVDNGMDEGRRHDNA
jgi:hypothetical protein